MSLKGAFGKKTTKPNKENIDEHKKLKLKIEKDKQNFQSIKEFERMEMVKEKIITASREDPKNVDEKKLSNVASKLADENGIKDAYLNKNFKAAMVKKKDKFFFLNVFTKRIFSNNSKRNKIKRIGFRC